MEDLSGRTLQNNYYLREKKPSGQIADVYYAWDRKRAAEVAVKVLHRDRTHDNDVKRYFTHEAELMARLDHPHIVRFYEFGEDGQYAFFVMDWVKGSDLKDLIASRNGPFSLDEVLKILNPIASALNYAHTQNIIHCDIKPANILIEETNKVLLTDFGIARYTTQKNAGGTPPYMAPEQFEGGKLSPQTDIYSLGVTVFELLSGGQVPFRGETENMGTPTPTTLRDRIYWEVMNMPYPGLVEFNPKISLKVDEIIRKSMLKNPEHRFGSAIQMYKALENAGKGRLPTTYQTFADYSINSKNDGNIVPVSQGTLPLEDAWRRKFVLQQLPANYHGPYLVTLSGELSGQICLLIESSISVGRSRNCEFRLSDRSVSRRHASFQISQQGVFIRDEGSSLGTWVNGQPIQSIRLYPGDIIQIGYSDKFEFSFT